MDWTYNNVFKHAQDGLKITKINAKSFNMLMIIEYTVVYRVALRKTLLYDGGLNITQEMGKIIIIWGSCVKIIVMLL